MLVGRELGALGEVLCEAGEPLQKAVIKELRAWAKRIGLKRNGLKIGAVRGMRDWVEVRLSGQEFPEDELKKLVVFKGGSPDQRKYGHISPTGAQMLAYYWSQYLGMKSEDTDEDEPERPPSPLDQYIEGCSDPGKKRRSKGKGRGLARGKGEGPMGEPGDKDGVEEGFGGLGRRRRGGRSNDPRRMTAKSDGIDSDGRFYKKGDEIVYFPIGKKVFSGVKAEKAWREFQSSADDEKMMRREEDTALVEKLANPKLSDETVKEFNALLGRLRKGEFGKIQKEMTLFRKGDSGMASQRTGVVAALGNMAQRMASMRENGKKISGAWIAKEVARQVEDKRLFSEYFADNMDRWARILAGELNKLDLEIAEDVELDEGRKYHVLVGKETSSSPWEVVFGDYSKSVVDDEKDDERYKWKKLKVVTVKSDDQASIDALVKRLNEGVELDEAVKGFDAQHHADMMKRAGFLVTDVTEDEVYIENGKNEAVIRPSRSGKVDVRIILNSSTKTAEDAAKLLRRHGF